MRCRLLVAVLLLYLLAGRLSSAAPEVSPARQAANQPPHIVLVSYEDEYSAEKTLSQFARTLTDRLGWKTTILAGNAKEGIRDLGGLEKANALVLYVRRKALPPEQMEQIRRYLAAGKPLVALRTTCHAFEVKEPQAQGLVQWPEFGRDVLGANYTGHCGRDHPTEVTAAKSSADHPILAGVTPRQWTSTSWLYNVSPIDPKATVLLWGKWQTTTEPAAWTRTYGKGRVFFTSLGDAKDFTLPQFRRLLINGLCWTMDIATPKEADAAAKDAVKEAGE